MAERLPRELLEQINKMSTAERDKLAAAAQRRVVIPSAIGLRYQTGDRIRDLATGLIGHVEHAGRDERTGWEVYRVRLVDLRVVFRTDRELARDSTPAPAPGAVPA